MASLEPYKCKHCGSRTKQYVTIDIRFKQRPNNNEICHDNVPVFLCEDCLQDYVDTKNNNKAFKRKDMIAPLIVSIIALVLPALGMAGYINFMIVKVIIVCALIIFGIYCMADAAKANPYDQTKEVLQSFIPIIIGIVLIFTPIEVSMIVSTLVIIFAFLMFITSAYSLIRGYKKSKIKSSDLYDAIKFYFKADDDIDLLDRFGY